MKVILLVVCVSVYSVELVLYVILRLGLLLRPTPTLLLYGTATAKLDPLPALYGVLYEVQQNRMLPLLVLVLLVRCEEDVGEQQQQLGCHLRG